MLTLAAARPCGPAHDNTDAPSHPSMSRYDAIVVGAGHNGLTSAAFLARSGLRVLVLERNPYVGGATVSRELHAGWIYSNCSYVCSLLRPEIYRSLELGRHGLQIVPYGGGVTFTRDGDVLGGYVDKEVRRREIARYSRRDADAYLRYGRDVMRQCRLVRSLLMRTPPDPTSLRLRDLRELLHVGREFAQLGEMTIYDTVRFYTMSIADYLAEYFESDVVRANFAGSGIIGTALGVHSPGTAYVLLHHYMGDVDGQAGAWGFARGGMGAVAQALAGAVRAFGGEIKPDAPVARILVRGRRVTGVALESGAEYHAPVVLSALDPKRTFLGLFDPGDLDPALAKAARDFKIRGSSGKLNIALDGLPEFPSLPPGSPCIQGDMHVTDTLEMVERAYDDWKDGRWSRAPYVDMLIPSQIDPTMTRDGKHYMSVFVQYCPYQLSDGAWTDVRRKAFGATVIDAIARHSPDFKSLILHAEVRTPWDIENEVGLTEGNIFQGELTMDQLLFNRPVPGGGVMGAPGANAARTVLRDLGRAA